MKLITAMTTAQQLATLIADFILHSEDGYAVFDASDQLLVCNQSFAALFAQDASQINGATFADLARFAFLHQQGIRIDHDDIEQWLLAAQAKRRQRSYRIFEVDLVDGRWFLFSEQLLSDGRLLIQSKEITRQKLLERDLSDGLHSLRQLALTDELTQIANRRCFVDSVHSELSRSGRQHSATALLVLDVDFFKSVNDSYGHQAGDAVLAQMAAAIKHTLREYDIFGRIGGEEFAIFLSQTDADTAVQVAERVRTTVAATQVHYQQLQLQVTVSIGVCTAASAVSFETLYNQADLALYQAKHNGRNQVCCLQAG